MNRIPKFNLAGVGSTLLFTWGVISAFVQPHQMRSPSDTSFYDLFKNVPVVQFDPDQNTFNDGIIGEISYAPMGGDWCPGCEFLAPEGIYEPLDYFYLEICSKNPLDQLFYEFSKPDGKSIYSEEIPVIKYDFRKVRICYDTGYGANIPVPEYISTHLGKYKLSIQSKKNSDLFFEKNNQISNLGENLSFSFVVDIPNEPRLYPDWDDKRVYLINFQPNEFVNLYCFENDDLSNTFRVDANGKLVINNFRCPSAAIAIEGVKTGLVLERHNIYLIAYRNIWDPFPNNCPSSRLEVGDLTVVSDTPPVCNNIRKQPSKTGDKIECVDPGTTLQILGGPECSDGVIWWRVKTKYLNNDIIGWTAEGDNKNFWLLSGAMPNYAGEVKDYRDLQYSP